MENVSAINADVLDPTDEERANYQARIDRIQDDPIAIKLGRNPTELVRAYEAGEDRTELLREASYLNSVCWDESKYTMANALERRLFLSRTGAPLEVSAYLGHKLKLRDMAEIFIDFDSYVLDGEDYVWNYTLVLLLFDEEAVLIRAHHDFGMPGDGDRHIADLIFFSRSVEFELNTQDVHASPPPLEPTRRATMEAFASDCGGVVMESKYCTALEQLVKGRRLVAWSGFAVKDEIVPHADIVSLLPYFQGNFEGEAARLTFAKVVRRMYQMMVERIGLADLPPPGALRRSRNWQVRGPHVVLRSLLEKRRAGLGRGALLTYYYLHGKMPAAMFRVVLSFL